MTETPWRKWLRVHLSTAVLLMFAAGGLIWFNVTPRIVNRDAGWCTYSEKVYGWPYHARSQVFEYKSTSVMHPFDDTLRFRVRISEAAIASDLAVALAILFVVWFVCERWIAWRAGRKKE
ncbi:MAG TPA: hypothetical protein VKX17_06575 [Planctomycetota bacterium]|nr:hypothetical protein [Planctomycetota bacterium]